MPAIFALEFGEMLYQLRAALDGAAYACAIFDSWKDPPPKSESISFPVCKTSKWFKNSTLYMLPLSEELRGVVEPVQPYNRPKDLTADLQVFNLNRALLMLHDWSRADRHRKLHFMGAWASAASPKLRFQPGSGIRVISFEAVDSGFLEKNDRIASFQLSGYREGLKVEANPDFLLDIEVDEAPPRASRNDTLNNRIKAMFMVVEYILSQLEGVFDSPRQPGVSRKPRLPQ